MPHCLAPCLVPELERGRVVGLQVGQKVTHGESLTIHCTDNYEVAWEGEPTVSKK